ncbi:hypothetical protein F1880_005038 [Penicillium rolfsii]|nr:hypothetical protein F1880_005038 [Penicillium rolfsii]
MTSILSSGHDFMPSDSIAPLPTENKAPATPTSKIGWLAPGTTFSLFTEELFDQLRFSTRVLRQARASLMVTVRPGLSRRCCFVQEVDEGDTNRNERFVCFVRLPAERLQSAPRYFHSEAISKQLCIPADSHTALLTRLRPAWIGQFELSSPNPGI